MLTRRDQDVLNFIEEFRVATSGQIHRLFFANKTRRYCQARLKYLLSNGYIKKINSTINNEFAYYLEKRSGQVHHDLIRAELYSNIKLKYNLLDWSNEQPIKNIRPDATAYLSNNNFAYIRDHGMVFPIFIEIHLSNKFNFEKYINLLKKTDLAALYGIMPRVIICTDRQVVISNIGIKFKVVGVDMSGLDSILK